MNILAVRNLMATGIDTAYNYLQNLGINTLVEGEWKNNYYLTDKVPSLTLGGLTYGVKLFELCAAYGTIANMGEYNQPIFYTKVLDHDGNILLENNLNPRQVLRPTTAYILTDMMKDTLKSAGTAPRAAFDEVAMPIAGKTGTTSESKDLGFTGYTPYYVASVWLGYDQPKTIQSSSYHLYIWKKIMEEIHRGLPEADFMRPEGITTGVTCRDSGMACTELCRSDPRGSRAQTEIFAVGTVPSAECTVHQQRQVCSVSGMCPGPYCPAGEIVTRIGSVRPEPVDYEANPGASVADSQYEFTKEVLDGEICTFHTFVPPVYTPPGYYPPYMTDPYNQYPNPYTPLLPEPAYPTPTPAPVGTPSNIMPGEAPPEPPDYVLP
jgi:penicillin-binding protein 1A